MSGRFCGLKLGGSAKMHSHFVNLMDRTTTMFLRSGAARSKLTLRAQLNEVVRRGIKSKNMIKS
jgi:hypothetical protein